MGLVHCVMFSSYGLMWTACGLEGGKYRDDARTLGMRRVRAVVTCLRCRVRATELSRTWFPAAIGLVTTPEEA